MGTLSYTYSLTAGQPENVNQLNQNLEDIKTVLNGNVDANNISATLKPSGSATTSTEALRPAPVFTSLLGWHIDTPAVPSGDTDYIGGAFLPEAANETRTVTGCRYIIKSGTSVTFKLQKNGSDMTGFTSISATTTAASTTPTAVAVTANDIIRPVITAVSGSPRHLELTVFLSTTVL